MPPERISVISRDERSRSLSIGDEDPRLLEALERYAAALDSGHSFDETSFLREHADIADRLSECLEGLRMLHHAGREFQVEDPHGPSTTPHLGGRRMLSHDLPLELGDFSVRREVGRGGMGVVYEAHQRSLGRRVALKVLPFAATLDPRHLQRFKTEAMAAACLQHPHIVPVYSVGHEQGVHYYAMQFIDGISLLDWIRCRQAETETMSSMAGSVDTIPDPSSRSVGREGKSRTSDMARRGQESESPKNAHCFRWIAKLGVQAAEALDHAHGLGILHRDVKPANLLIDSRENLWVTDFGLARIQAHASVTRSGDILGTLRYMSPEQALARRTVLDHRADVYSLGASLYEALTLTPVFDAPDNQELVRQIVNDPPRAPRKIDSRIPRDLETIVLKALAKEPEDRYGSAQEMADDLNQFLRDRPIRARRPSVGEHLTRWARRHKPIVAAVGVMMVFALGVLSMTTFWLANERLRVQMEHQHARQQQERILRLADEVYEQFAQDQVTEEPKPTDRKEVLARALVIFEGFANSHSNEPSLVRQTAMAFRKAGDIHFQLGRYAEAEQSYASALKHLEKIPDDATNESLRESHRAYMMNRLARIHALTGRYGPALQMMEQAARTQKSWAMESKQIEPRMALVTYLLELGKFRRSLSNSDQAQQAYTQALAISDELYEQAPTQNVPPSILIEVEALRSWSRSQVLRQEGSASEALAELGTARSLYGVLSEDNPARQDYRQRRIETSMQMAWLLATHPDPKIRRVDEAARLVEDCLTQGPTDEGLFIQAAQILVQAGRESEAERLLSRVITIAPDRADAHNNLAWLLVTANEQLVGDDAGRAVELAEEAVRLSPELGIYWNTLGIAHYRAGNYREAVAALEKSMALRQGGDSFDWFFLAMAHWKLGERDSAFRIYNEAVQWMDSFARENSELSQFRREADAILRV